MVDYQKIKSVVRKYISEFDNAHDEELTEVLKKFTTPDFKWRGMHPFNEQLGIENVVEINPCIQI